MLMSYVLGAKAAFLAAFVFNQKKKLCIQKNNFAKLAV